MSWECRDWLFSLDWRDLRKQTQVGAQQTVRVLLTVSSYIIYIFECKIYNFLFFFSFIPSVSLFLFSLSLNEGQ
jgi:hypothetical protein